MNFELTKEQEDIRRTAREFTEKEFKPEIAREFDKKEQFPRVIYRKAAELGFTGLRFPEEYGGQGYGCLESLLVTEEFCRADSTLGHALSGGILGGDFMLTHGNEQQKKKYLPNLARGEMMAAGGITEPAHGCDIVTLDTTAKRDGEDWVINGRKTFITNAPIADFAVAVCQTNSELKHRGQTLFVVEKGTKGFEASELKNKLGIRMTPIGELSFDNVKVTKDALVGEENKGFYHTLAVLDVGRIMAAGRAIGMAQGASERALKYSKERMQFNRPISEFQAVQHKLAEAATLTEAARQLAYKAAWCVDKGSFNFRTVSKMCSMAKLYAANIAATVVNDALQIFGGYGYFAEYDIERYYRDIRVTTIYEGTNELQRNSIFGAISQGY